MYMSGFFPCMMFGIPGAALAMVHTAKSNKKKAAIGIVSSAAICAFICGVTEPVSYTHLLGTPPSGPESKDIVILAVKKQ